MSNFDAEIARFQATPGAVLIDLRDAEDYAEGHIPAAVNVLLGNLREEIGGLAERDTPIFLYCYGGMRSFQAEALLQAKGYSHVTSIGGLDEYHGALEE